ncbi:hypothetical protein BLD25_00165 [Candidatus Gracilibacteria bacterium GN02-872]|nr:hypothetical protein BLD25_00165 [Candidatus Gracilibacteria bacterium GN02-872]
MSQKGAKVMAILALAGIIISVIGTSLLYFLETGNQTKENSQTLTEDEVMKLIEEAKKSQSKNTTTGKTNSGTTVQTGTTSSGATSSGTVNK